MVELELNCAAVDIFPVLNCALMNEGYIRQLSNICIAPMEFKKSTRCHEVIPVLESNFHFSYRYDVMLYPVQI